MIEFKAESTYTNRYGHTGYVMAKTPSSDKSRPGELQVGVLHFPEYGGNESVGTYISYDGAERLRDWLNDWLIENWPQEDDE